jgi:hypothetical protein
MFKVKELALELLNASNAGDVKKCIELSDKIKKIMDTYKNAC